LFFHKRCVGLREASAKKKSFLWISADIGRRGFEAAGETGRTP
jgi:hypothetical protein